MTADRTVDVRDVLESTRVGPLRIGVVAVCALVVLLDGFVAGLVAAAWSVPGVFGVLAAICLAGGVTALALRAGRSGPDTGSAVGAPVAGGVA